MTRANPDWVEYDKTGRVVRSRVYPAPAHAMAEMSTEPPAIAPPERPKVNRGVVVAPMSLFERMSAAARETPAKPPRPRFKP